MKKVFAVLLVVASCAVSAEQKAPANDDQMFMALNIMAVPIGEKGMIIKDQKGCLWVIKNSKDTPLLVAVLAEGTDQPLCEAKRDDR